MTTVLLWGDQWWLPGRVSPISFGEKSQAAPVLARSWGAGDRSIRIVFEPDDLVSSAANCPNTKKAVLRAALSEEFPTLGNPTIAWSHEPILATGGNFGTLVHHERERWLQDLVKELEGLGFAVESVVPMPTWLNALPGEVTASGAVTIFAVSAERFCLYRHSAGGVRTALKRHGSDALETLVTHLRTMVKDKADEFVFGVVADDGVIGSIGVQLDLNAEQWVGALTVSEALGAAAVVPAKHPAQFIPPKPIVTVARVVSVATILIGLAVGVGLVHYARAEVKSQTVVALRAVLKEELQKSVAQLRANQAEAGSLRAEIASLNEPASRAADFIRKIGSTVTADIVLTEFRIEGAAFTLRGWSKAGAGEAWAKSIVGAKFSGTPAGAFTVEGAMP